MGKMGHWWAVTALAAVAASLATLLAASLLRDQTPIAFGQAVDAGSANYVIGMLGPTANDRTPLYVIDTKSRTILIYEYLISRRRLLLRVARSFEQDRELQDNNFYDASKADEGPSVRDVQRLIQESARSRGTGATR